VPRGRERGGIFHIIPLGGRLSAEQQGFACWPIASMLLSRPRLARELLEEVLAFEIAGSLNIEQQTP
jgi:hypothetical protein